MQTILLLTALGILAMSPIPASAQDANPVMRNGEIVIPSEKVLEKDAVTQPRNDFSPNDTTATQQMERQNRKIDREVDKGICSDC